MEKHEEGKKQESKELSGFTPEDVQELKRVTIEMMKSLKDIQERARQSREENETERKEK